MRPVLFELPFLGKEIPSFGLMMTAGFLLGIWWAVRRAIKSGADPDVVLNIGFISLIAGVVGCRIMFVWHYWDQFARIEPIGNRIWAIINLTQGGMEFYGGFLLTFIAVLFYLYFWGLSIRWYLDIVAPSLALGMAFGRVGCFLNGCCFGGPCELPWATEFPYGSNPAIVQWERRLPEAALPEELVDSSGYPMPIRIQSMLASDKKIAAAVANAEKLEAEIAKLRAANAPSDQINLAKARLAAVPYADLRGQMKTYNLTAAQIREMAHDHSSIPIHPAQLYSTAGLFILAFLLNALYWVRPRDGTVIFTLLLIEPVSRWLLEIIRADNPTDTFGFTISQFIAICLTLIGFVGLLYIRNLPARAPAAKLFVPEPEEPKKKKKNIAPA